MFGTLEVLGFIIVGIIAIFIPCTVLAISAWHIVEYNGFAFFILVLLTILAIVLDSLQLNQK